MNKGKVETSVNNVQIRNILKSETLTLDKNEDGEVGRIEFIADYLTKIEADSLYESLCKEIKWQVKTGVNNFGDTYDEPRMTYWYGMPYKYSSVTWDKNEEWNPHLDALKTRISKDHDITLNSVMCNYYRNANDSIGWHADDETSLGRCPTIASISLGEVRVFEVCKKQEYYARKGKPFTDKSTFGGCTKMLRFHLSHGSLLLMKGSVQDNYLHRVPKGNHTMAGRINLTFRRIVNSKEEQEEIQRKKKQAQIRRNLAIGNATLVSPNSSSSSINDKHKQNLTPDFKNKVRKINVINKDVVHSKGSEEELQSANKRDELNKNMSRDDIKTPSKKSKKTTKKERIENVHKDKKEGNVVNHDENLNLANVSTGEEDVSNVKNLSKDDIKTPSKKSKKTTKKEVIENVRKDEKEGNVVNHDENLNLANVSTGEEDVSKIEQRRIKKQLKKEKKKCKENSSDTVSPKRLKFEKPAEENVQEDDEVPPMKKKHKHEDK